MLPARGCNTVYSPVITTVDPRLVLGYGPQGFPMFLAALPGRAADRDRANYHALRRTRDRTDDGFHPGQLRGQKVLPLSDTLWVASIAESCHK